MIYTIGYQGLKEFELVKILKGNGITMLIDVRSRPYSKNALFNKPNIQATVEKAGITYRWAGRVLGGFQADLEYDDIRKLESYQKAINRLMSVKDEHRVCLMCMEKNPTECHRNLLIGMDLEARGVRVVHLNWSGKKSSNNKNGNLFQ